MPWTEPAPSLTVTTPRGRWNNALAMELESKRLRQWPAARWPPGGVPRSRPRGTPRHRPDEGGRLDLRLQGTDDPRQAGDPMSAGLGRRAIGRPASWYFAMSIRKEGPATSTCSISSPIGCRGRQLRGVVGAAVGQDHRCRGTRPLGRLGPALMGRTFPAGLSPPARARTARAGSIGIVDVADLPALYGQPSPPAWPPSGGDKPLDRWKMETDDAPILEYLWRLWRPRRHLEFGTWEGFGATLVGQSTGAEIWTINLPQGESGGDRELLYASSDAGANIGWRYRAAGLERRVHQLLCDSRDFETNGFAADFFDTVLIDGGHTPDLVENDTDKALRVLRPGGLCIWHDFCPDPAALSRNLAPLGVVQAIVENIAPVAAAVRPTVLDPEELDSRGRAETEMTHEHGTGGRLPDPVETTIETTIPGMDPIELVAYYEEFRDYYPSLRARDETVVRRSRARRLVDVRYRRQCRLLHDPLFAACPAGARVRLRTDRHGRDAAGQPSAQQGGECRDPRGRPGGNDGRARGPDLPAVGNGRRGQDLALLFARRFHRAASDRTRRLPEDRCRQLRFRRAERRRTHAGRTGPRRRRRIEPCAGPAQPERRGGARVAGTTRLSQGAGPRQRQFHAAARRRQPCGTPGPSTSLELVFPPPLRFDETMPPSAGQPVGGSFIGKVDVQTGVVVAGRRPTSGALHPGA